MQDEPAERGNSNTYNQVDDPYYEQNTYYETTIEDNIQDDENNYYETTIGDNFQANENTYDDTTTTVEDNIQDYENQFEDYIYENP